MSFEDIKGQDRALEILKEGILRKRIFSSYLFVGPDGVGKAGIAKNFAKALNCLKLNVENVEPCEECISCQKINLQIHPDVFFVEPKGPSLSISIDQIRTVKNFANFKPYQARKKVFIINDAHSMKAEASNAFLKTLEEPPKDTIFILIARSKDLLLPTIVSRSLIIKFFGTPPDLTESVLIEKFKAGRDEAKILTNFSSGRIGAAIKMKERNLIDRKNRLIDSIITKQDFSEQISAYSNREELKENLEILASFFRDIFLYKAIENPEVIFHIDRIAEIKNQCKRFTLEEINYLIKRIIILCSYIDYNVNPKIIIDVLSSEIRSHYARGSTSTTAGSG